jgi:hypothetical protein
MARCWVFVGYDPTGGGVYSVSTLVLNDPAAAVVDLAQEAALFEGTIPFTRPIWSPFAPIVAFSVFESAALARIEFVDTRDGTRREVTDGVFGDVLLDWSPRRGFLVFARHVETAWFLVMARITNDGSDQFIMGPQKWGGFAVEWDI